MYYPKSKILENQYTNGGQLLDTTTGLFYRGLYHATFDGKYFSGPTHTLDSIELVLSNPSIPGTVPTNAQTSSLDTLITPQSVMNVIYDSLMGQSLQTLKQAKVPTPFFPTPTDNDYTAGKITRYFMKLGDKITEISADGFTALTTNVLYTTLMLDWKLTGPVHDIQGMPGVYDTNRRVVLAKDRIFRGISSYLTDYIQFGRISE